ncbi:uncharacterized protein LOC111396187 [Olea europaea var. sylvestris]|uniref:uncharacterized protein LOC111396187 n=1 Tax=Olea europaea var. sylvestris TaxID=158386 RepID=UPI000C1D3143|nr:uncharacterized protein LOC111396187 [Olea europaea var. sylvestris]
MSSLNSPQIREPKPESETPIQEFLDPRSNKDTPETLQNQAEDTLLEKDSVESIKEPNGGEEEEEEEGECGFCLFMKGGGCKDTFIEWENCVEEGEKNKEDIVEKCFHATAALKKCMEAHSDYYAPILLAEKVAEEEAVKELEKEKEKERLNSLGDDEKSG